MNNREENVALKEGFKQVVVWHACCVPPEQLAEFEQWVLDELKARVQFLECVETLVAMDDGTNRIDALFAIHTDDIPKFALARFKYGMRWLEDVYGNSVVPVYPSRISQYKCWDEDGSN